MFQPPDKLVLHLPLHLKTPPAQIFQSHILSNLRKITLFRQPKGVWTPCDSRYAMK